MLDIVQATRPSLREERAEVTRRRIVQAARVLFARDGDAATTLRAIASEAGVAVQTVYAIYGAKAGVLRALRERAAPARGRSIVRGRDGGADGQAAAGAGLLGRSGNAGSRGPTSLPSTRLRPYDSIFLCNELEDVLRIRRAGLDRLAMALEPDLAPGMDPHRAGAILDALTLPELWAELIDLHGWTPDQYEAWLRDVLGQQLLGD